MVYQIWRLLLYRIKYPFNKNVHLLHIGKTGVTAIKYALKPHLVTPYYVIKLHPHRVKLRDIPRGDYVIFFLRDPITRFVSGFYSRKRQGQPRFSFPWSHDERIAFEKYDTPNRLATTISSEDENERDSAIKAMQSIGHIKSSYWEWFESESYFLSRLSDILFMGFQETLSEDFERLKLKLGLPENVKLPTDEINAHQNPSDIDKTLDQTAIENLKEWYASDYAFIRLCKQYIQE
jgi:hypothetical protein